MRNTPASACLVYNKLFFTIEVLEELAACRGLNASLHSCLDVHATYIPGDIDFYAEGHLASVSLERSRATFFLYEFEK